MTCLKYIPAVLLQLFVYTMASSLDFEDPGNFNASTCVGRVPIDGLATRSCDCGPFCSRHKTCCIDAPFKDVKLPSTLEECTWVQSMNRSVFMVSKCSLLWDGQEGMKELCEGGHESWKDPVSMIPVTGLSSGVTYANVFCSMCNMEEDVEFWNFELSRVTDWNNRHCAAFIPRALEYTNVKGEYAWGYWQEHTTNLKTFISLDVKIEVPSRLQPHVTGCFEDSVSQCPEDWDDEETRRKCESYMAVIEVPVENEGENSVGSRTYRNMHCALCNGVQNLSRATYKPIATTSAQKSASSPIWGKVSYFHKLPGLECVKYGSTFPNQHCQTVICDPGYKIQFLKCVPEY